jgi:transposase
VGGRELSSDDEMPLVPCGLGNTSGLAGSGDGLLHQLAERVSVGAACVDWGLAHRIWGEIQALGIDEIAWRKGHQYLTPVYQIDEGRKRLLWIGRERKEETLRSYFRMVPRRVARKISFVCSDMWKPYLTFIAESIGQAVHLLDRFHVMTHFGKAIDEIRAGEVRQLKRDGYEPVLKHSRWCLLKRPENMTMKQTVKLAELLKYNLRSVRAYLLKDEFQRF